MTRGQDLFGNQLTFLLFFVGFFFLDDLQPRARGGNRHVIKMSDMCWGGGLDEVEGGAALEQRMICLKGKTCSTQNRRVTFMLSF